MRRRAGAGRGWPLLVPAGLVGSVAVVYVVVVLGGGALLGRTSSPSLPMSVLATAVVALGFAPVQSHLTVLARRGRLAP